MAKAKKYARKLGETKFNEKSTTISFRVPESKAQAIKAACLRAINRATK